MKKLTSVEQITSHEAAMSDGTIRPTRFYRGELTQDEHQQEQFAEAARVDRRASIIEYIQSQLGPDLCNAQLASSGMTYGEAVIASVSTGCYDHEWGISNYTRVEKYIAGLRETFRQSQGDCSKQVARLLHLRRFGTPEQRDMLAKLELL